MVLIQLLLPAVAAPRPGDQRHALEQTRAELASHFSGLTAYVRSPAKGLWTAADGRTEEDDVVMVEIVAETFDRAWWGDYAAQLRTRFRQEAILVRALAIEVLDTDAT